MSTATATGTRLGQYSVLQAELPVHGVVNLGVLLQDPQTDSLRLRLRRDFETLVPEDEMDYFEALSDDLSRKAREWILARRLEQSLTKDEIFGLYLNHIYLGHGRYGIEEAVRYYFNVPASKLDVAQSALLAGLVASPENYSPRRSPAKALVRRKFVLDQMRDKGFVTPDYYAQLIKTELVLGEEPDAQSTLAPEAVEVAKDAKRPFVVNAGMKRVIAVGTQFSVFRDGDNVRVVVSEGTVRIEDRPRDRGICRRSQ